MIGGLSAYALGGDDFAVGGCGPLGEPLPERCCWGAGAFGAADGAEVKGAGAVLCEVGDLLALFDKSAPYAGRSCGAGDGAIAIAVLMLRAGRVGSDCGRPLFPCSEIVATLVLDSVFP